jgi:tetratricopeptide (TPR) repeat protein
VPLVFGPALLYTRRDMKVFFLSGVTLFAFCAVGVQSTAAQVTVSFDEPHNSLTLSVPGNPAALQIDLLHLKLEKNELDGSATRRRVQASDGHGWVFSAFVYPLDITQTAEELSNEALVGLRKAAADNAYKIEAMKTFARGDFSLREYIIPDFRGQPIHQKNLFGYATSGEMGFDFHISKISYSAADDRFFDSLISGLHVMQEYKPDSATEFGYGSIYYLHQDWAKACAHYEKSLQLERQKRALNATQWNVLVDNLGMAYAMSGDISKAKATFAYGTQENPTYPMFRYNLACADSELGDLDGALEQLRLAFQYKSNSNPGEGVPDPTKDDSFKNYLSDPRFAKLAKELCPSSKRTEAGWLCQ